MRTVFSQGPIWFLCFAGILGVFLGACRNCCEEPGMVEVPSTDATPPQLSWMVTRSTGTASSIAPYSGREITVRVSREEAVKVYLLARDEQSGIRRVSSTGGGGWTCSTSGAALIFDLILPTYSQSLSFVRRCSVVEWSLPEYSIETDKSCSPGYTLRELRYGLRGTAENAKGGRDTSFLDIIVEP